MTTLDLSGDGEIVELVLEYFDHFDNAPYEQGGCDYSMIDGGMLHVGNWRMRVTREDIKRIIGPERVEKLEEKRADGIRKREIAA
jgi:hypothetical protein